MLKAACLVDLGSKSRLNTRVNAARVLWEAILVRLPEAPAGFSWSDVGEADFLAAEQRMAGRWSQATTHLSCGALARLAEVIASAGIMRSMQIPFRTRRPDRTYQFTLAGREAYEARLPSREAVMAVADIYAEHAKEPSDRLLACVLALLIASGLRIGEVLTLACDCLVSEGVGDKRRWGIRFAKEKSLGRRRVLETRWLTVAQAVLVRAAVAEVLSLTEAPRERARILEAQPDTVPLPNIGWHATLTTQQVAALLGIKNRRR